MKVIQDGNCMTTARSNDMRPGSVQAPLKWHGGKHYLAPQIVDLMPPRCMNPNKPDPADPGWLHYVEPYFGGGSVLLANDPTGISEVVNDIDGQLTNFWQVLQGDDFDTFRRRIETTPFSQTEWEAARAHQPSGVGRVADAVAFFICCRQSLAGRGDCFASISRNRTRRGMNEQAAAWLTVIHGLPAVRARLQRVTILNRDALEVICKQDGPRTLFYLDPPYLHETRTAPDVYRFEMSERDHRELLRLVRTVKGKVMLSGYRSDLYDERLTGWSRRDFDLPNNAAGGPTKRRMTECVWCNFGPAGVIEPRSARLFT